MSKGYDAAWRPEEKEKTLGDYVKNIQKKYPEEDKPHKHYFKDVSKFTQIDVYRIIDLWGVTDPCLQHALKKILVAGGRGHKDTAKDVQDIIDTLERWKEMQVENNSFNDKQKENSKEQL